LSLDVQDWVWEYSQSKGVARTVLLAIADKATGKDCSAYAGTKLLVKRANAARSSVQTAIDTLLKSKELKIVKGKLGPRGETWYSLPKAVGHRRNASDSPESEGGPISGPGPEFRAPEDQAPGGPEIGPGGPGEEPQGGTGIGPHNAVNAANAVEQKASRAGGDAARNEIPDFARPLVDGLTANDVIVRWPFTGGEWLIVHAVIKRSGIPAMVAHARKVATRTSVESARYFIQGWKELPPIPAADTDRPPLRAVAGGWQPFQNPTDPNAYDGDL